MKTRLKFAIFAFAAVATVAALAAGALGVFLAYDSQSSRVDSLERAYLEQSSQVAQLEQENKRILSDRETLRSAFATSSKQLQELVRLVQDQTKQQQQQASVLGATSEKRSSKPKAARRTAQLVLTAGRGSSWLDVHVAERTGKRLYRDTLARGRSLRFSGESLWLRIGRPPSLRATLNGKAVSLPPRTATIVVTVKGIRVIKLAGARD